MVATARDNKTYRGETLMFPRRFLAVVLIMLLTVSYSSAFLITVHKEITEMALTSVSLRYSLDSNVKQALNGQWFTDEAIREIVNANLTRDVGDCPSGSGDDIPAVPCGGLAVGIVYADVNDPGDHFDDELFMLTNNNLIRLRNTALSDLQKGKYIAARKQVGFALHSIQDFYAHTNWIDLGKACCATRLGFKDAFTEPPRLARKDEPTCPDDPSILLTDQPDLLKYRLDPSTPLTSGYFPDTKSEIQMYHKCAHGSPSPLAYRGINKDSDLGRAGTRVERFNSAKTAAQAHTSMFVNSVLAEGCGTNAGCVLGFMGYPSITSINPITANVGQNTFYLHVLGAGFTEARATTKPTVYWNNQPLETAPRDLTGGTQLDARIEQAFLAQPGPVRITVKQFEIDLDGNVTNNLLESNAVNFTIDGPEPDCPGRIRRHLHDPAYMDVNANRWNDTGRVVAQGQTLNIQVVLSGSVVWRSGILVSDEAPPEGDSRATPRNTLLWIDPPMPINEAPVGALIGMIVDSQHLDGSLKPTIPLIEKPDGAKYFRILTGGPQVGPMPATGRLYLGINDGAFFNNGGCFQVRIVTPPK
jgi:hypothetical protein